MKPPTLRQIALTTAIAIGVSLSGPVGVPLAAAGDGADGATASVKRSKVRVVRGSDGMVMLPNAANLGPSNYYWYRQAMVRREQVYLLSAEPKPDPGWYCCLMLGIAY